MNEAALMDSTTAPGRHLAWLASRSLTELVTAAGVHLAALNAGVNVGDDEASEGREDAMDAGLKMDAALLRLIAARPAVTLADLAAKARLAQERLAVGACLSAEESALLVGLLDDVARFSAAGAYA